METIIQFVLLCLYTMLPGAVANMMPVFVKKIPFLAVPIDFGKKLNGKPIFGSHKTYRGFFFGIIAAIAVAYIQSLLYSYNSFQQISFFNFDETSFLLIGLLIGFGVLSGDLVKSFFKRLIDIKPGARFFPWDQIDFIIGGLLFMSFIKPPSWQMVVFYLGIGPCLHILFNHIGFWIKIRESKW